MRKLFMVFTALLSLLLVQQSFAENQNDWAKIDTLTNLEVSRINLNRARKFLVEYQHNGDKEVYDKIVMQKKIFYHLMVAIRTLNYVSILGKESFPIQLNQGVEALKEQVWKAYTIDCDITQLNEEIIKLSNSISESYKDFGLKSNPQDFLKADAYALHYGLEQMLGELTDYNVSMELVDVPNLEELELTKEDVVHHIGGGIKISKELMELHPAYGLIYKKVVSSLSKIGVMYTTNNVDQGMALSALKSLKTQLTEVRMQLY